jgi:hypothetical protein
MLIVSALYSTGGCSYIFFLASKQLQNLGNVIAVDLVQVLSKLF